MKTKIVINRTAVLLVSTLLFLILHQQKISLCREEIKKNREAEQDLLISEIHTDGLYAAQYLNEALAFFKKENLDIVLLKSNLTPYFLSSMNSAISVTLLAKIENSVTELKTIKVIKFFESLLGFQKEYSTTHDLTRFSAGSGIHSLAIITLGIKTEHIFICFCLLLSLVVYKGFVDRKELKKLVRVLIPWIKGLLARRKELEEEVLALQEQKDSRIREIRKIRYRFQAIVKAVDNEKALKIRQFLNHILIPEFHRCYTGMDSLDTNEDDTFLKQYLDELLETEILARKYLDCLKDCGISPSIHFIDLITVMVKQRTYRGGFAATIETDFRIDWTLIKQSTLINLFHAIAEAIEQCIQPAKATMVTVAFKIEYPYLVVTIKSNESGGALLTNNGIGLIYTESHMYPLRGNYIIDSTPGEGTTLMIYIPLITKPL